MRGSLATSNFGQIKFEDLCSRTDGQDSFFKASDFDIRSQRLFKVSDRFGHGFPFSATGDIRHISGVQVGLVVVLNMDGDSHRFHASGIPRKANRSRPGEKLVFAQRPISAISRACRWIGLRKNWLLASRRRRRPSSGGSWPVGRPPHCSTGCERLRAPGPS